MTGQDAGQEGEEIKAALKKVGARNDPFARCSLCKKDWNGGEGHEHEADHAEAERDGDFLFIREEKGGRIWTDYDGMAKWVAAHVDAAVAEARREERAEIAHRIRLIFKDAATFYEVKECLALAEELDPSRPPASAPEGEKETKHE